MCPLVTGADFQNGILDLRKGFVLIHFEVVQATH